MQGTGAIARFACSDSQQPIPVALLLLLFCYSMINVIQAIDKLYKVLVSSRRQLSEAWHVPLYPNIFLSRLCPRVLACSLIQLLLLPSGSERTFEDRGLGSYLWSSNTNLKCSSQRPHDPNRTKPLTPFGTHNP